MSICDTCSNYQYDEDYECYVCMVDLDEDDMSRFLRGGSFACSFYQRDDRIALIDSRCDSEGWAVTRHCHAAREISLSYYI